MNTELFSSIKCPKCNHLHFAPDSKHIPAVKCAICGKLHEQEGHGYIAVQGNITMGLDRGIIGNNMENDVVVKVSIFCKGECFNSVCSGVLPEKDTGPVYCPKGGVLGDDFIGCGRKPDCSEKHPKAYAKCLELSE